jgi:hypothetical protein
MSKEKHVRNVRTLSRDAIVRTRTIVGFESTGLSVSEAKAAGRTKAFFRRGNWSG